jgi:hypothetical protein
MSGMASLEKGSRVLDLFVGKVRATPHSIRNCRRQRPLRSFLQRKPDKLADLFGSPGRSAPAKQFQLFLLTYRLKSAPCS